MRLKLAVIVSALSALAVCASASSAQPLLSILSLYSEDDHLCVDFYLKNAIEKDILSAVRNGVPALLSYRIEIWEDRANWYDKLVKTFTYSYKIAYDNWDTLYSVDALAQGKTETGRAKNVGELIHILCNQKKLKTCPLRELSREAAYYVNISAAIQSLSAERVREIESWLGGTSGGGGEGQHEAGGLLGFVVDVFGSKAKQAEARSNIFALEALAK